MNIPIIQGYKKPVSVVCGGGKYNCLTTEIAHRTNSYGLPHVLTIYELWQQYTKWKISPNKLGGGKAKPFAYAPHSTREEEIIV